MGGGLVMNANRDGAPVDGAAREPRSTSRVSRLNSIHGLRELLIALRMAGVALWVRPLMRWLPLPRVMALLDPGLARTRASAGSLAVHLRVAEGVFRNARRRLGSNCMRRSLVLFRFLRRLGFPAVIVFGIKRNGGGELDGHAWIELDGVPVLEPGDPREEFAVAFLYPAPQAQ